MVMSSFNEHMMLLESKQMWSNPRCVVFKLSKIFLRRHASNSSGYVGGYTTLERRNVPTT